MDESRITGVHTKELPSTKECTQDLDVDRLYVERNKGGRGLMSERDVVQYESHSLKQYTRGNETEIIRKAGLVTKVDSVQ